MKNSIKPKPSEAKNGKMIFRSKWYEEKDGKLLVYTATKRTRHLEDKIRGKRQKKWAKKQARRS